MRIRLLTCRMVCTSHTYNASRFLAYAQYVRESFFGGLHLKYKPVSAVNPLWEVSI